MSSARLGFAATSSFLATVFFAVVFFAVVAMLVVHLLLFEPVRHAAEQRSPVAGRHRNCVARASARTHDPGRVGVHADESLWARPLGVDLVRGPELGYGLVPAGALVLEDRARGLRDAGVEGAHAPSSASTAHPGQYQIELSPIPSERVERTRS